MNKRNLLKYDTLPYLIFLVISVLVVWSQIKTQSFISGTDSIFHMNRFYETAMQIKTGHFNYFQSIFGFNQSGRVVNAFYGPVMAYLSGLLLLICRNWVTFEIVNDLLALSLGGYFMYLLLSHNKVGYWLSIILSTFYMTSYPISIWLTNQEFTGWGSVFLPLVIWCGIYTLREHRIHVIALSLAIALVVQVHLASSIIVSLTIIPLILVGIFYSSHKEKLFMQALEAVGLVILLTGNVWGSILDMFSTNHIIPIFPQKQVINNAIGVDGLMFNFLDPFIMIILVVMVVMTVVNWERYDYVWKTIASVGVVFLWLSSQLFPWNWVHTNLPEITNFIQFPKRLIVIPIILLLLALGQALTDHQKATLPSAKILRTLKYVILTAMASLSVFLLASTINNTAHSFFTKQVVSQPLNVVTINNQHPKSIRADLRSTHLKRAINDISKSTPDYLPSNKNINGNQTYYNLHPYYLENHQYNIPKLRFHKRITSTDALLIKWHNPTAQRRKMTLPLSIYHQSMVHINHKKIAYPNISKVGALRAVSHPGNNEAKVQFMPDIRIQIITLITIFSWIVLSIHAYRQRKF